MFQAVYISDNASNIVFEYTINLSCPSFKTLDNLIQLKQKESDRQLIEINTDQYVCIKRKSNLVVHVLCSSVDKADPLMTFAFLNLLIESMENYFGTPLSATKIEANSDTLTLMLNQMIGDGIPNILDLNTLRDIIPRKDFFTKILESGNDLVNAASRRTFLSTGNNQFEDDSLEEESIPWRSSKVKYTNNSMYVDVIETVNVLLKTLPKNIANAQATSLLSRGFDSAFYSSAPLSSSSRPILITGHIDGQIDFTSHLSGIPYVQMVLKLGENNIECPAFHRCIKVDKWLDNPGNLYFIPPDAKSTLMNYQIDLSMAQDNRRNFINNLIDIDLQTNLGFRRDEFEIRLLIGSHSSISRIENIVIEVHCPSQNLRDSDETSDTVEDRVTNIKPSRVTNGDFSYRGNGIAEWKLNNVATLSQPLLRASLVKYSSNIEDSSNMSSESGNLIEMGSAGDNVSSDSSGSPLYVKVTYSYKGGVPSGVKLDSLKIISAKGLGETVKPFKGVRYISKTGNYILRT